MVVGRSYDEKKKWWHLKIPPEMNNLRLHESDKISANQKLNESNKGVFVVAEFDLDNNLSVGLKLSLWRGG